MKEDYITLKFSLDTPLYFKLGDYVDDPRFGRFELCDLYKPTYNTSTGGYDYDLRLDAYYWKWKNKIFKFTPETGGQEASWHLTASLRDQSGVFLRNLQALGYKYGENEFGFEIDGTVEDSAKLMTYDSVNLLDALTNLAQAWECEWWITEHTIHFGRCEYGTPVDFRLDDNVETMDRSDSQTAFATRIYAFGSTRNLPTNYRPIDESMVVNGVVQKRLMLPIGTPYIDAQEGMSTEEAIEDIVVFEDVYPRRTGTVSDITPHEYTDTIKEEGKPDVIKKWNAYRFKDPGITFSKDYRLAGQELKIRFQSGLLNGMEFSVIFNSCDKEGGEQPIPEKNEDGSLNPAAQVWEIVRNEDYGRPLPDGILYPRTEHMELGVMVPSDTYILSGFDPKFVSESMLPDAERELKDKAEKYVAKTKIDPSTYNCKMMSDYMYGINPETGEEDERFAMHFDAGDKITLINGAYFEAGSRQSRIIGFEYNLDIPYDCPMYTIGETASYSRIGEIEDKIESLTYKGQTYTGGNGGGVYVIGTNDTTPLTNRNVFSALRSVSEFINKKKDDKVQGIVTFLKGLKVGEYASGKTGGIISVDESGKSYAEFDYMKIRLKAYFETLEIQHVNSVGGKQIITPGGSISCIKVEEYDTYWRCYFLGEQDGIKVDNRFAREDFAFSQNFNIKPGVHQGVSNHYYWRAVIGTGDDYIDLSKSDCDTGSGIPAVGDIICQLGNKSKRDRQNALIFSSVDLYSPSVTLYSGINTYSYLNREYVSYGVDKSTNEAFFNVYGNAYIGDRDKNSYFKYTQAKGVEIKGKLVTESGRDIESAFGTLQDQIDGVKETFYGEYTPALSNFPANEWTTEALKQRHELDVFTNIQVYVDDKTTPDSGNSWRWVKTNNVWGWMQISDSAASKAYYEAAQARKAAEEARNAIDNTNKVVSGMKGFTDKAFSDGIVDRSESSAIATYLNNIQSIQKSVNESYSKVYNNPLLAGNPKTALQSAYNGFNSATNELISAINNTIADGIATIIEKANVDAKYSVFNLKYGDFIGYLNAANKEIQDIINGNANKALNEIGGYEYIKKALKENTSIEGGLVQSSLLMLGYTHPTEGFKVMAGTNGIYDTSKLGGGIATWCGGSMKDRFEYTASNIPSDAAKGVDRMDGTGYRANGNFWWDADGKVHADPLSFFVGPDSVGDLLSLFQFVKQNGKAQYVIPQLPFQKLDLASQLSVGDVVLKKKANKVLEIDGDLLVTGNITQYGGVSAGSSIFDGIPIDNITLYWDNGVLKSKGTDGMDEGKLKTYLDTNAYINNANKANYLPSWALATNKPAYAWAEIGGKPTTFTPSAHNHNGDYVQSLGTNGNYLTWTKNGAVNNITVPYATIASKFQTARTIWGQSFDGTNNITGDLVSNNKIRTTNVFSAGEGDDNSYGFVNVARTNSINNASCFSWVRAGVIAFGLGFNTSNNIVIGQASSSNNKVISPWLTFNGNSAIFSGALAANGSIQAVDGQFISTKPNGTAPLNVISSTVCNNLNADMLDGYHAGALFTSFTYTNGTLNNAIGGVNRSIALYNAMASISAGSEQNGYLKFAKITVNAQYQDKPLFFLYNGRGVTQCGQLMIRFNGGDPATTSLAVNEFWYNGNVPIAYAVKTSNSTYDLYITRTPWQDYSLTLLNKGNTHTIEWLNVFSATLPSYQATSTPWNPATQLYTARTFWGQSFDGLSNVSGALTSVTGITMSGTLVNTGVTKLGTPNNYGTLSVGGEIHWTNGDATLAIYGAMGPNGSETSCIQTSFDSQNPTSSTYPTTYPQRAILALQPRGGRVVIGKTTGADYSLDIAGTLAVSDVAKTYGLLQDYAGSSWISMFTRNNIIKGAEKQTTSAAHALYCVESYSGHKVSFGGLNNHVGFYGIYKATLDAGTNRTDWSTRWDTTNGYLSHSAGMGIGGLLELSGNIKFTTSGYHALYNSSAQQIFAADNNGVYVGGTVGVNIAQLEAGTCKLYADRINDKIGITSRIESIQNNTYAFDWAKFFNPAWSMIGNVNNVVVQHNGLRSILSWRDTVYNNGWTTSYSIGCYRENNKWGTMILSVSNNDAGTSRGAELGIKGDGTVYIEGNLLVTGGITQYATGVSPVDTFTSNILKANNCLLVGSSAVQDAPERMICCYRNASIMYINLGNNPSAANTAELSFNYVGNGSGNNSIGLGFYGGTKYGMLQLYASGANFLHGSLTASGSITQGSDMRRKTVVRLITQLTTDQIANAPLFDYYWKDLNDGTHTGTSAQYWQNVLPNTVRDNGKDGLSLDYNGVNIAGLITVSREIVKLKRENEELRQEINKLKEREA